jgi:ketosteroid isomerase-like protein
MSEENVEIVRQLIADMQAGVERGDPGAWLDSDAVAEHFEWVAAAGPDVDRGVYFGREGFDRFMIEFLQEMENWSIELERLVDAGDRVVVIYRHRATGKASGATVEWQMGQIAELKDGRLIRCRNYATPADALEAAGLSE